MTDEPDLLYADGKNVVICYSGALIVFDREKNTVIRALDTAKFGYTHMEGDAEGVFEAYASNDGNTIYFKPGYTSKYSKQGIYEIDNNAFYYSDFDYEKLDLFDRYIETNVLLDAGIFKKTPKKNYWYSYSSILLESDTFLSYATEESKVSTLRIIVGERNAKPISVRVFPG